MTNEKRENSKWKKALLLLLCLLLVAGGSVMGTMAYLTHKTDTMTNTFHVGNVKLQLLETPYDVTGTTEREELYQTETFVDYNGKKYTAYGNEYKLLPGSEYLKDPFVVLDDGSEKAYIYAMVKNGLKNLEVSTVGETIEGQISNNGWVKYEGALYNGTSMPENTTLYFKRNPVAASQGIQRLFSKFKIDSSKTNTDFVDIDKNPIEITAFAVQYGTGTSATDAWDATFGASDIANLDTELTPTKTVAP